MLALVLKILAVLHIAGLVGLVFMLQQDRFDHIKKQLALSALAVFVSGVGIIFFLEEIQPFLWDSQSHYAKKKKKGGGGGGAGGDDGDDDGGANEKDGQAALSGDGSGTLKRGKNRFADCPECPEMIIIPKGVAAIGANDGEPGAQPHESPRLADVTFKTFAIGRFEITRGQFAAFVKATGHRPASSCRPGKAEPKGMSYVKPGFAQDDWHPVVCVSHNDAAAYVAWLSKATGRPYRLPSASEWEYAARAESRGAYSSGEQLTSEDAQIGFGESGRGTTTIGSFSSNKFGLHDVHGNAAEWVEDCWTSNLKNLPKDGTAFTRQIDCKRVIKGGAWFEDPSEARSAARAGLASTDASNGVGFRVARDLE